MEISIMKMQMHTLATAMLASLALLAAGCDQPNRSAETAGQKIDRATDKMAANTKEAATKTANAADDAAVTTKVKAALFAEPGLKTLQINVDTKDAVVTLEGTVDSDTLRQRAVQIATSTNGVRQVVDKLVVKTS
jgi:hyperosmotically inducible periplasmic protein